MHIIHLKTSIVLVLSLVSLPAFADIYEYIDEAGVSHYSDTPDDEQFVLIIKTEVVAAEVAASAAPPVAPSNPPIITQNTDATNLSMTPPFQTAQLIAQIEQSAKNNQLDSELIHAVMHVESAYKTNAKSPKGAQGLMQLMPATASRFGVNNSNDPAQNIEGGAKYLRELLNLFNNDVSLAVAAYNAGEQAVIKYGNHIPPYKETQAYVPKVLNIYKALLKQRKVVM
jgi:soluble lytic murein transglycosylase-like protein